MGPTSIIISPEPPSNSILVATVPSRFDITSPCSDIREKEDIDCCQHAQDLPFMNWTPFYSTLICTETALAVNSASSILTPVSFFLRFLSPTSLFIPYSPTLIAPITATFYDFPFFSLFRLHSIPLRSKVLP